MSEPFVSAAKWRPESDTLPGDLTARQRAVVDFIEQNPRVAAFSSAKELAGRVGVHSATVVRLAQLLGYDGYAAFREAVRHRYLASLDAVATMRARAAEGIDDVVAASVEQDIRNLVATGDALDPMAVRAVSEAILGAGRGLVVGNGSHAGLAVIFAHLCQFMGLPVEAEVRGGNSLAMRLALLGPGDVLVATASWWVIDESRRAMALARERGATTVAVVESPASGLAATADHVLVGASESASFFQSMAGQLTVLNALVADIAQAGGEAIRERMAASTEIYEALGLARQEAKGRFVSAPAAGRGP